jgi:hypothetical protein
LTERNGRPAQNFAAVCRAVLSGDSQAAGLLHYVAFDLLSRGGADLGGEAGRDRRGHLGEVLPIGSRVRQIDCLPATMASHAAMIDLGFGILLDDPLDLAAYGAAVRSLLNDPARAEEIGREAKERVRHRFLGARTLVQAIELYERYPQAGAGDRRVY